MTDKETLYNYRINQAIETQNESQKMLESGFSTRSIINRAYYSMFYALQALLIKTDINVKTSKHTGIISAFDRYFVKTGKIDKQYSRMLHDSFDARLEVDYKDFVEFSFEDAKDAVENAKQFVGVVKDFKIQL